MNKKITDQEFDEALAKELPFLNRKERRLAERKREQLKNAMSKPKYVQMQNVAGTTIHTEMTSN